MIVKDTTLYELKEADEESRVRFFFYPLRTLNEGKNLIKVMGITEEESLAVISIEPKGFVLAEFMP